MCVVCALCVYCSLLLLCTFAHFQGDSQIRYFEITDESPYVFYLDMYQSNVPQRGAGVLPKVSVDYMHCEVMKFYKVQHTKGIVEPISMKVPRKVRFALAYKRVHTHTHTQT